MRVVTTTIMTVSEFEELTRKLGIVGYDFLVFMEISRIDNAWNFFVDEEAVNWALSHESKIVSKPVKWSNYANDVLALLVGKGILSGENFSITESF